LKKEHSQMLCHVWKYAREIENRATVLKQLCNDVANGINTGDPS